MMTKDDGGPAYPFTPTDRSGQIGPSEPGKTLRDAAAIAALTGLLGSKSNWLPADLAHRAYVIADAMLAERAK